MKPIFTWRGAVIAALAFSLSFVGSTAAVAMSGVPEAPSIVDGKAPPRPKAPRAVRKVVKKPVRVVAPAPPASPAATPGAVSAPSAPVVAAAPACPSNVTGTAGHAPSLVSEGGVGGTTSADLASFAVAFNGVRVANCLPPIPVANFRYDACMEQRLVWIAEDPSTDPSSAWGHIGTQRSDGVPSVGCDGNLAGGMNNTSQSVAVKWWNSSAHRTSLYKPTVTSSTAGVCIFFAMTHGGVPDEPSAFTRAAARWGSC